MLAFGGDIAEEERRAVVAQFAAAAHGIDELLAVMRGDEAVLDLDIKRAEELQDMEGQPLD